MYILHQNKCEGATITASSENPDYDFTTAFNDDRLSRVGRTVSDASQTIDFDLLSSVPVSKLMIQDHNLSSGMTASLEGFTNNPLVDPTVMNLPLIADALDISGNGNNGTATNITWTGGVANFNGVSSKILTPIFINRNSFSISVKFYVGSSIPSTMGIISSASATFRSIGLSLLVNSKIEVLLSSNGSSGDIASFQASISSINLNSSNTIALTYDGSTYRLYINNNIDRTYISSSLVYSLTQIYIGVSRTGLSAYFTGTMSNFYIFNRVLTDAERTNLFLYNDYFAPDYTTALTYNATYIYKDLVTDQTYRYWRLSISDASNPDDYIEISKVFLGTHLSVYMDTGMSFNNDSNSSTSKSTSGQMYGNRQLQYKSAKFVLSDIDATKRTLIKSFWNSVDIVKPFWLIIWEDSLTVEDPIYCVLTKSLSWSRAVANGNLWSVAIEIEEIY